MSGYPGLSHCIAALYIYPHPPESESCELLSGRRYSRLSQRAVGWLTRLSQAQRTWALSATHDLSWMEMTSELRDNETHIKGNTWREFKIICLPAPLQRILSFCLKILGKGRKRKLHKDQINVELSHGTKQHLIRLLATVSDFPLKAQHLKRDKSLASDIRVCGSSSTAVSDYVRQCLHINWTHMSSS